MQKKHVYQGLVVNTVRKDRTEHTRPARYNTHVTLYCQAGDA